jgi:hypothetical protein
LVRRVACSLYEIPRLLHPPEIGPAFGFHSQSVHIDFARSDVYAGTVSDFQKQCQRMSHYARNHLQDDWASHAAREASQRLETAERTAGWYFEQATRRQRSAHEAELRPLLGTSGPKWDRAREALRRRFAETTAEAGALFDRTVTCLLATGEVSDELDAWTALCEREDGATSTTK